MLNNRIPKIKGTKKLLSKNLPVLSLGLPSLDAVIGGGLPIGSCILLEEDELAIYASVILKHYLAEGVTSEHPLLLASEDANTTKIIADLPSPLLVNASQTQQNTDNSDQLRIAWRYQHFSHDKSSNAAVFGNTYDMGNPMTKSDLAKVNIDHWDPNEGDYSYDNLLSFVRSRVEDAKYNFKAPVENRTALRIALCSLGTASWRGDIVKFLIKLRVLLRNSSATCLVTIPAHLLQEPVLHRCEHLCDTVIELKSLLNDGNPAYSDYEGLLMLKKLPVVNAWCPTIPDSNDWAFKLKKKRFIIEKLHISPELTERTHREGEDVSNDYKARIMSSVAEEF